MPTDREELERARTELDTCARALEKARADLDEIAHAASHDLLEPSRTVTAYAQLLERRCRGKLGPEADEILAFVLDGATRMSRLLQGLLECARVGARGGPIVPTDCGLVLRDVLEGSKPAVLECGAEILSGPLPRVRADPSQIAQLLRCLLDNALKFRGADPPRVRIQARREGGEWVFSVEDNGIGFDVRFAERIFVLFERLHPRDRYPGTGTGLAVCRRIVARHSGRIWAESAPGRGSTFYFALPAADAG